MSLSKQLLAKVDGRLRAELDHSEDVQLVKVPVSDAVWSTWRRYCEIAGVPMGRGLSILLHHELASIVDEDIETVADRFAARQAELDERSKALAAAEKEIESRRRDLSILESDFRERERKVAAREENVAVLEQTIAQTIIRPPRPTSTPKPGRNEPCWCGSGKKYKVCHLLSDS